MTSLEHNNDPAAPLLHQVPEDDTFRVDEEKQKACRSVKEEKALYPPAILEHDVHGNVNEGLEATRADKKTDNKEKINEETTEKPQEQEKRTEEEREARTAPQGAAGKRNSKSLDALYALLEKVEEITKTRDECRLLLAKNDANIEACRRHFRSYRASVDAYGKQVQRNFALMDECRREADKYFKKVDRFYERVMKYSRGVDQFHKDVDEQERIIEQLGGRVYGPSDDNPRAAKRQKTSSFESHYYR